MLPKIGLNIVPLPPDRIVEAAIAAEANGFESVWSGEHVLVPVGSEQNHPGRVVFAPDSPFLEPLVALSHLAAVTRRIRLGIGILILPLRDVFLTAKAVATLDVLSRGRLDLGIGVGWMREEFDIIGRRFENRGRRADEMIRVMDALFSQERAEFHGEFHDFGTLGFAPKPVQKPRPKIHVGGWSEAAYRRAALLGDGYYGTLRRQQDYRPAFDQVRRFRREAGLEGKPFEMSLNSLGPVDRETLEGCAASGVDRVVVTLWKMDGRSAVKDCPDPIEAIAHYGKQVGLV